jgi:hypothetical protein
MHSITRLCLQTHYRLQMVVVEHLMKTKANQITNDLILCEQLAEKNTNPAIESYNSSS